MCSLHLSLMDRMGVKLDGFGDATTRLTELDPNNARYVFDHAQNQFYLADVAYSRSDWAKAKEGYQRYNQLAERLVALKPDNIEYRKEVAYGTVLQERRKALHERTAQVIETLYRATLDEHYSELAHHYTRSGKTEKAVEYLHLAVQQAVGEQVVFT